MEEEKKAPGEAYPEGKHYHHRFRAEHFCRTEERDFEGGGEAGFIEFGAGVSGSMALFAEFLCSGCEDYVAAGFGEDEVEGGEEGYAVDNLDVVNPAPGEGGGGLDCAADEGAEGDSYDGGHAEDGHGGAAGAVAFPDVGYGAGDDGDRYAGGAAAEEAGYEDCGEVGGEGGGDKPDDEEDVCGLVKDVSTHV